MGASGLWTVTRAHSTRASKRQTSAIRWARVSIRSTGFCLHGGFHRGHETSVVDGVMQVVGGRRRAGVEAQHEVDHEGLALALLELEDAVVAEALDARSWRARRSSVLLLVASRAHAPGGRRRLARTSCTRRPHTPRCGQQRGQGGVGVPRARRPGAAAAGRRPAGCRGTTCGSRRPAAGGPGRRARRGPASSCQLCVGGLGEAQARVEHDPVARRSRRRAAASTRSASSSRTAADHAAGPVVHGEVAACGRCARASASRRTSRRRRPRRRGSRGSARPPETSLTTAAPASSGGRGDLGAHGVDRDRRAPSRGERSMTGTTRSSSSSTSGRVAPGPGGLAADVEQVGAVGEQLAAVRDGGVGGRPSGRRRRTSRG